ncbi:MAG TPA: MFS transporter [Candidatus Saccharimonadales bacterium]|nr:MFS transporter [Candidatus Saccharimonadales bacterium]
MHTYRDNPKWLLRFAPFKTLSVSTAFLAPFFMHNGLNQTEIFALQSIFSLAVLLWELPSGYIADKIGRALCIKLSAPVVVVSMIGYGLSDQFWQFVVWELGLALANGLISGADSALLYDSLHKPGQTPAEHQQAAERATKRMNAYGFAAPVICLPLAMWLAHNVGLGATFIADGLLTGIGLIFVLRLKEAPLVTSAHEEVVPAPKALRMLLGSREVRWLLVLYVSLSTCTYMGAWLATPVYVNMGIPVALFAAILAARNLWKAAWSHWFHPKQNMGRYMTLYVALGAFGFAGMASGNWWLLLLVLGHEIVHALQGPAIMSWLNGHMHSTHRATLNSGVNLLQRLSFTIVGPLAGMAVDTGGLRLGLLATGGLCTLAAGMAVVRLYRLGTFGKKG